MEDFLRNILTLVTEMGFQIFDPLLVFPLEFLYLSSRHQLSQVLLLFYLPLWYSRLPFHVDFIKPSFLLQLWECDANVVLLKANKSFQTKQDVFENSFVMESSRRMGLYRDTPLTGQKKVSAAEETTATTRRFALSVSPEGRPALSSCEAFRPAWILSWRFHEFCP